MEVAQWVKVHSPPGRCGIAEATVVLLVLGKNFWFGCESTQMTDLKQSYKSQPGRLAKWVMSCVYHTANHCLPNLWWVPRALSLHSCKSFGVRFVLTSWSLPNNLCYWGNSEQSKKGLTYDDGWIFFPADDQDGSTSNILHFFPCHFSLQIWPLSLSIFSPAFLIPITTMCQFLSWFHPLLPFPSFFAF